MRVNRLNITDIKYEEKEYTPSMYQSIKRIGLSFPIKVNLVDGTYYCLDGHKRLCAIRDIIASDASLESLGDINVIIYNDGSTRSNDCWNGRNTH